MDEIKKTKLKGRACIAGTGADLGAMVYLAHETSQHCEKLGDAALAAPYCAGMGMLEVGLLLLGFGLVVNAIKTVRDRANYLEF